MLRRVAGIVALVLGSATFAYASWAMTRTEGPALSEPGWPKAFPYPDTFLLALNNYYDAKHPARGFMKLHGELPRVRRDLIWARCAAATLLFAGVAVFVVPQVQRVLTKKRQGFDVEAMPR